MVDGPIDDLIETEPTVLAVFEPEVDGEQVLFQDTACTVPATDYGQHTVGGVRDAETGDIILTQASEAQRMLLVEGGLFADGVDDELVATVNQDASAHSVAMRVSVGAGSENNDRIYGAGKTRSNVRYAISDPILRTNGSSQIGSGMDNMVTGESHVLIGVHAPTSIVRWAGMEESGEIGDPTSSSEIYIASSGGDDFAEETIAWWAYWDRALDMDERKAVGGVR